MTNPDQDNRTSGRQKIEIATPQEIADLGVGPRHNHDDAEGPTAGDSTTPPSPGTEDGAVDWKDKFLRAKADAQNLQRRAAQEQQSAIHFAIADFARGLLEVLDNLERTLQAGEEAATDSKLLEGVKLVHDNLLKMLKGHGVEQIESLEQPFDPHLHQAMMQEQAPDQPPNTVIREIHKGYRMNERILRVASVIVSATQESTEDGKPASPGA